MAGNIYLDYDIYEYTERCYDYEDFSPTRSYQHEDCYEDGYVNNDAYDDDYEDLNFNCK